MQLIGPHAVLIGPHAVLINEGRLSYRVGVFSPKVVGEDSAAGYASGGRGEGAAIAPVVGRAHGDVVGVVHWQCIWARGQC